MGQASNAYKSTMFYIFAVASALHCERIIAMANSQSGSTISHRMKQMKIFKAAALASIMLVAGCASQADQVQGRQEASLDDAPTGSLIKRRPVKDANGNIVKDDKNLGGNLGVLGTVDTKQ